MFVLNVTFAGHPAPIGGQFALEQFQADEHSGPWTAFSRAAFKDWQAWSYVEAHAAACAVRQPVGVRFHGRSFPEPTSCSIADRGGELLCAFVRSLCLVGACLWGIVHDWRPCVHPYLVRTRAFCVGRDRRARQTNQYHGLDPFSQFRYCKFYLHWYATPIRPGTSWSYAAASFWQCLQQRVWFFHSSDGGPFYDVDDDC